MAESDRLVEQHLRIFLDMDDVMADFRGFAVKQLGYAAERYSEEEWVTLARHPRMYRWLEPTPWSRELFEACINLAPGKVHFLTAVPKGNDIKHAFQDKVLWAKHWFPCCTTFFGPYSKDKWTHCTGIHDVLIDDRQSNIDDWRKAGGTAIHFKNIERTLKELACLKRLDLLSKAL